MQPTGVGSIQPVASRKEAFARRHSSETTRSVDFSEDRSLLDSEMLGKKGDCLYKDGIYQHEKTEEYKTTLCSLLVEGMEEN